MIAFRFSEEEQQEGEEDILIGAPNNFEKSESKGSEVMWRWVGERSKRGES